MMKRLQSIRAIFNRVPTQLIMTTDNDFFLFKKKNSKLWEIGSGMLQENISIFLYLITLLTKYTFNTDIINDTKINQVNNF